MWLARKGIEDLNEKYRRAANPAGDGAAGDTFFLFHRPRRWNPEERVWMGYERKRGKLADLNALLRGGGQDRFSLVVGETAALSQVKYVITLDTDTQLPRDSARQFVGVMAHPLNRARFDTAGKRKGSELVTEGYGILQPRVCISLPGANRSWYARLHGGDPGIDPYTRAVSDVYQDVFREGSFIGKGIYDVDAFEQALGGRFPENRILSHDLLEGCYARSGLLCDVQLYEEHPSTYRADISRRHRWIRGDWQLVGWLLPLVPGPGKRRLAKSAVGALAVEALRQPAAQPRPAGTDAAAAARMDRAPPRLAVDVGGDRDPAASIGERLRRRSAAQAGRGAAAAAPRRDRQRGRPARRANGADTRLPAVRGDGQPRCDRTDRVADARHASTAARVESVGRRRTRPRPPRRHGQSLRDFAASVTSMWIAPVIATATAILLTMSAPSAMGGSRADTSPVAASHPESHGGSAGRSPAAKRA